MEGPPFAIEITAAARWAFRRMPDRIEGEAFALLHVIAIDPFDRKLPVKPLEGRRAAFRVQIGDWRVVFVLDRKVRTTTVIAAGPRGDVYR